jgi:hypothetical protein
VSFCEPTTPNVLNAQVCAGAGICLDTDGRPTIAVDGTTVFLVPNPAYDPNDPTSCETVLSTSAVGTCGQVDVFSRRSQTATTPDLYPTVLGADSGELPGTRITTSITNTDGCERRLILTSLGATIGGVQGRLPGGQSVQVTLWHDEGLGSGPQPVAASSLNGDNIDRPGSTELLLVSNIALNVTRTISSFLTWDWESARPGAPVAGSSLVFAPSKIVAAGLYTP